MKPELRPAAPSAIAAGLQHHDPGAGLQLPQPTRGGKPGEARPDDHDIGGRAPSSGG
jgi:hypothetical protein